jgi:hypothetical protein
MHDHTSDAPPWVEYVNVGGGADIDHPVELTFGPVLLADGSVIHLSLALTTAQARETARQLSDRIGARLVVPSLAPSHVPVRPLAERGVG